METRDTTVKFPTFKDLPSEVIQQTLYHVSPQTLAAVSQTSRRLRSLTEEPLLWRHQCRSTFAFWRPSHDIENKLARPAADTNWRALFTEQWRTSRQVTSMVEGIVSSQHKRIEKMQNIAELGYDAKDALLELTDTSEDADDYLAKRWWSRAALDLTQRRMAVEVWMRLDEKDPGVTLEEALGAFDVFTLGTRRGDFRDITQTLDDLAVQFRAQNQDLDEWSTRRKTLALAAFLRESGFRGIANEPEDYRAIQNNYLGYALLHEQHQTLPLVLMAIYICLANRFGIDAYASNVPMHIFGLVKAPDGETLDGRPAEAGKPQDQMFIDPYRHENEVPETDIRGHLLRIGVPDSDMEDCMSVASVQDLVLRTTNNIRNSVKASHERGQPWSRAAGSDGVASEYSPPPLDESAYAALWAQSVIPNLAGNYPRPTRPADLMAYRAGTIAELLEKLHINYPWDVSLLQDFVLPIFARGASSRPDDPANVGDEPRIRGAMAYHNQLVQIIDAIRTEDSIHKPQQLRPRPPPTELERQQQRDDPRAGGGWSELWEGLKNNLSSSSDVEKVQYRIGSVFRHRRYGYEGVIVGWDTKCERNEDWIRHMGVRRLPGGREQSFYHVLAADKTSRYVAQENIELTDGPPSRVLMSLAGRFFKRWDAESGRFISNIRDEYPDD